MTSVMRSFTSTHKSIIKPYCGPDRSVTATPKSRRHILTSESNDGNPHRSIRVSGYFCAMDLAHLTRINVSSVPPAVQSRKPVQEVPLLVRHGSRRKLLSNAFFS